MSNLNKAMIIGRLGADPEARVTKSGQSVTDFRVATNENWKDRQGQRQERTEWHRVVAWGQTADFVTRYLKKGSLVFVEGRLQTRDWTDQQNVKHYTTEIVAQVVRSLDRPSDGAGARGGGGRDYEPDYGGQGAPGGQAQEPDEAYIEDDIPF